METLIYHPDTEYKLTKCGYETFAEEYNTKDLHRGPLLIFDTNVQKPKDWIREYVESSGSVWSRISIIDRRFVEVYLEDRTSMCYTCIGLVESTLANKRVESVTSTKMRLQLLQQQVEEYKKECAELREECRELRGVVSSFREFSEGFEDIVKQNN